MRLLGVVGILGALVASQAGASGIVPLACDQVRTDDLVTVADRDTLTFGVTAGERFYVTIREISGTPGFEPHWRVLDPSGTEVVGANGHRNDTGPLAAGTHSLEVFDWGSDATGTYRIHLQRLTAATACEAAVLGCDGSISATISSPEENDLFTFPVTSDERFFVTVAEASGEGFDAWWRVIDASGAEVWGWTSAYRDDAGPFGASGSPYRIQVLDASGTRTGTYRMQLQRLTAATACDAVPLPCDALLSASIADPQDTDLFTFPSAEGERFWISVVEDGGAGFDAGWRLLDASGAVVVGWTTGVWEDRGPLPASGSPYSVHVVDWSATATGAYRIHLQRLTAGFACDASPLSCDVAETATIGTKLDSDLWTFSATAGEMLEVTVTEESGAGFDATWRLLDATGAEVVGWWTGVRDDRGPFPAAGTYTLQVADRSAIATGTYKVRMQRLAAAAACEGAPLPCDVPVVRTIDSVIDSDLLAFDVADGDVVYVSVAETEGTPTFGVGWRILDAGGNQVAARTPAARGEVGPLAASGNPYRVDLWDWDENGTGTVLAGLHRLNAASACDVVPFACDTTIAATLDSPIDVDAYRFDAVEGERVYVSLATQSGVPAFDPVWRVLDASGTAFTGWYGRGRVDVGPLAASGSPYSVQVLDSAEDGTGSYLVHLQRLSVALSCDAIPLGCDTTVVASLGDRIDSDLYRFDVAEGERVWIAVNVLSGTPGFDPYWRVLAADGSELAGFWGGVWADRGPFTAADGPCTIQVLDSAEDATGTYRIHLQRLTAATACEGVNLPRQTSRVDSLVTPLDSDLFTLVLPAEYPDAGVDYSFPISVSALTLAPAALDPYWRMIDGTGAPAGPCADWAWWDRTCDVPAAAGPYRIQVLGGSATNTGTYEITSGFYGATAVVTLPAPIPASFALGVIGPNPFARATTLELAVPQPGPVRLRVFDVRGREVARVVDAEFAPGLHRVPWDAAGFPGGVYFCRMEAKGFAQSRKLLLVR